jgi:hypothetical protein
VADIIGPVLIEITPISPTTDHTPSYTFSSTDAGVVAYSGSCTSSDLVAIDGENTVTFDTLPDGVYDDCIIHVTDSDGNTTDLVVRSFVIDSTPPKLTPGTPIITPSNNTTPSYTFSSSEGGTITYGGSCSSSNTAVITGANTVIFRSLLNGTYANCTLTITDQVGLTDTISIPSFVVDTTVPIISNLTSVTFLPPGVTFTWTTNKAATTRIEYGVTELYGSALVAETIPRTSHAATITGLISQTTYHYRFISTDTLGNTVIGEDSTFITPSPTRENIGSSG